MKLPEKGEIRKPSKTLAGVTPIAVMCKPRKCKHGTCLYCPSLNVPQSYTPKSPPVLRASILGYDSYEQVKSRLKAFKLMNHPVDKIEIIVMGGNFLEYPKDYQENFIKGVYDALNNKKSKSLESAKKLNEIAKHRCVAMCIETRPDTCTKKDIKKMLKWGVTRVEIGVQTLSDKIYKFVNRGHNVKDVITATKDLHNAGFKVGYHMMLALPLSDIKQDYEMFKRLFSNSDFKPDQLKIYPCQVLEGAALVELYKKGKYKPYTKSQTENLIVKIMKIIPNYCRVMRIMREIPPDYLIAGTTRIDLRKDIESKLKLWESKNPIKNKIQEIRFREIGFHLRDLKKSEKIKSKINIKTTRYSSSGGTEYFLEAVNEDNILFGLCRLRIIPDKDFAIIRELHVYGQSLSIGQKPEISSKFQPSQHKGLGKQLVSIAEDVCKTQKNIKTLKIISGVGVREYYKNYLGYRLDKEGIYMEKEL